MAMENELKRFSPSVEKGKPQHKVLKILSQMLNINHNIYSI
jgi:hypothetical protein